ncbi:MAG: alpha/beta hydrolase [Chloroflexi bacterium]|nr:alpha/beta hydrolase [Chloroflexota bacterium]
MSEQAASGYIAVKGAKLYYDVMGRGFPLVLVHSRWMHSGLWDEQVRVFSQQYQVVRYDVRGFGQSEMELIPYSDVDDLLRLFDHLGLQQAYLLGLSMGAEIALRFTLQYPERVKALVVSGASLDEYEWSEQFNQEWTRFAGAIEADDYTGAINQVVKIWVDGPLRTASEAVRAYTRQLMQGHTFIHHKPWPQPESLPGAEADSTPPVESAPPTSERERLGALRVPTLLLVGDQDWPEQVAMAGILAEYIPNSEKVIIPGAAHFPNLEQPQAFNRAVLDFLSRQA